MARLSSVQTSVVPTVEAYELLGAAGTYTGDWIDLGEDGGELAVRATSDVTGTLHIEDSLDGTTARRIDTIATTAAGSLYTAAKVSTTVRRYVRFVYVNGAGAQGSNELIWSTR